MSFVALGDLNQDRSPDLVLVGRSKTQSNARLLLNNKKGYFYSPRYPLPPIKNGVDHVELLDIDQDGDQDLLFFGKALR